MPTPAFAPGFRCSTFDALVLILGAVASLALGMITWWMAFVIGFTVAHFFLFCNVFRISRASELLWAAVFVALCSATILVEKPGWLVTAAISLAVTVLIVILEMRKPAYHGIGWRTLNPGLQSWWESRYREAMSQGAVNENSKGAVPSP